MVRRAFLIAAGSLKATWHSAGEGSRRRALRQHLSAVGVTERNKQAPCVRRAKMAGHRPAMSLLSLQHHSAKSYSLRRLPTYRSALLGDAASE